MLSLFQRLLKLRVAPLRSQPCDWIHKAGFMPVWIVLVAGLGFQDLWPQSLQTFLLVYWLLFSALNFKTLGSFEVFRCLNATCRNVSAALMSSCVVRSRVSCPDLMTLTVDREALANWCDCMAVGRGLGRAWMAPG